MFWVFLLAACGEPEPQGPCMKGAPAAATWNNGPWQELALDTLDGSAVCAGRDDIHMRRSGRDQEHVVRWAQGVLEEGGWRRHPQQPKKRYGMDDEHLEAWGKGAHTIELAVSVSRTLGDTALSLSDASRFYDPLPSVTRDLAPLEARMLALKEEASAAVLMPGSVPNRCPEGTLAGPVVDWLSVAPSGGLTANVVEVIIDPRLSGEAGTEAAVRRREAALTQASAAGGVVVARVERQVLPGGASLALGAEPGEAGFISGEIAGTVSVVQDGQVRCRGPFSAINSEKILPGSQQQDLLQRAQEAAAGAALQMGATLPPS